MKIKILHLYYDLMNLYGEYANLSILRRHLEDSGAEVLIDKLSIGDSFVISDYDFIYCGAGTESNIKLALSDLVKYRDDIKKYSETGTALFTGNALEMLGNQITDGNGDRYEGLGLADFNTVEGDRRLLGDAVFTSDFTDKPIVGFINKCSDMRGNYTPFLNVKYGIGNNPDDKVDGVRINNILGTHLTGPVMVKNPPFLDYILGLVTKGKIDQKKEYPFETGGYNVTVNELMKRFSK